MKNPPTLKTLKPLPSYPWQELSIQVKRNLLNIIEILKLMISYDSPFKEYISYGLCFVKYINTVNHVIKTDITNENISAVQ
tara:strand:- start:5917 stop:6159 length:243 start_codon:yes stop_codon:yes gene_type:complete